MVSSCIFISMVICMCWSGVSGPIKSTAFCNETVISCLNLPRCGDALPCKISEEIHFSETWM